MAEKVSASAQSYNSNERSAIQKHPAASRISPHPLDAHEQSLCNIRLVASHLAKLSVLALMCS